MNYEKTYMIPQSRIEMVQMPKMMDEFLGIAASNGGSVYAPEAAQGM